MSLCGVHVLPIVVLVPRQCCLVLGYSAYRYWLDTGYAVTDIHALCILCIAGQLLRHYSPDLEVLRVVGVTATGSDGRVDNSGERASLKEIARWVVLRSRCRFKEVLLVGKRLGISFLVARDAYEV